jgi:aconitate hydratase
MQQATDAQTYRTLYGDFVDSNPLWNALSADGGPCYAWEPSSYIARPPFFDGFTRTPTGIRDIRAARALAIFGDSVTTDHISPAGPIEPDSPAGQYLLAQGVPEHDFNSYGARRGNHEVMVRGTFANVRIRNLMFPQNNDGARVEGGMTRLQPGGQTSSIYAAAMHYLAAGTPTLVFAGAEYGTGSSRDWAAKGSRLLGVRAVVARSFERIHRANLAGMGVLPLQFQGQDSVASLGILGDEVFDIPGLQGALRPRQDLVMNITRRDGSRQAVTLTLRADTPVEVDYLHHDGILPYVLRGLLRDAPPG